MLEAWKNGICVHCDWLLAEGFTEEDIQRIFGTKKG